MPERITKLQVFIASPGDVEAERDVVERVVNDINVQVAPSRKLMLEAVRWETRVRPGVGVDAQDVVNRQIGPRDIFVGILWSRLGTRTQRARSGTVEEFERALEARKQNPAMELMVYFKTAQPPQDHEHARHDVEEVRSFRQKIQSTGITGEFADATELEGQIRRDLTQIVLDWKSASARRPGRVVRTSSGAPVVLFAEEYGQRLWNGGAAVIDDGYQRIASLARERGFVAEPLTSRITSRALQGATCLVYPIGPWGKSRLEAGELRTIYRFVAEGHGLLLLGNYAGPQHHGGNLNDLSARYGLTFEADAVTPAGFTDRNARHQHAARPGSGFEITARPAPRDARQGEAANRTRERLTKDVTHVVTLTPCSVGLRPDAVAVAISDPDFQAMESRYTAWSPNVDEWVQTDRDSLPIVAVSSVARVAAVGGWKTFLNTFIDDPRYDNGRLWQNLVEWLCERTS